MHRLFALASILALVAPAAALAQDLPPGPGADVTTQICSNCHGLDVISGERHSADGWRGIVDAMISNGAAPTPEQEDQIVNYLTATFPSPDAAPAPAAAAADAAPPAQAAAPPATPAAPAAMGQ